MSSRHRKSINPVNILNKAGKLDERETEIMHKHSELGYELLKSTDIDKKTLNLIRNHHQNAKKTGYPFVDNSFNADINLQILSIADKYSALTEKRSYKEPLDTKQALTIIYRDVQEEASSVCV
ncbi:MAG: HD-GYP domain-containing protein [Candidatus Gastranaerophilaceae bacterium]